MSFLDINQTDTLLNQLQAISEFSGFGIAFVGGNSSQVIRHPNSSPEKWIVLQANDTTSAVTEIPNINPSNTSRRIAKSPYASEEKSDILSELGKMGWSCGMLALAGVATAVTAGAAPVTAGQSLWLTSIIAAGSVASAYQCGDSAGRVINEIISPDRNDVLDSVEWYKTVGKIADGIGTASSIASGGVALKGLVRVSKITKRPAWQILKGYSKKDKRLIARELSKMGGKAKSNTHWKKLVKDGIRVGSHSDTQIHKAVVEQLISAVTNAISTGRSESLNSALIYIVKNN